MTAAKQQMKAATASGILDANDLPAEPMIIKEWGQTIYIRPLKGAEIGIFSKLVKAGDAGMQEFPIESVATVCALAICDESGNRLFPSHKEAVPKLLEKNWNVLQRIFKAALKISSMTGEDEDSPPGKT